MLPLVSYALQGVGASETKAFELYEKAAMRGSPVAMYRLGQCYEHGKVRARPPGLVSPVSDTRESDGGDLTAICGVWCVMCVAQGAGKDEKRAAAVYLQASKAGCAEAQNYLGLCYQFGKLVQRNPDKCTLPAPRHIRSARKRKREMASERDSPSFVLAAFQLFQQAAESGFVDALYNLGRCYHHGEVRDPFLLSTDTPRP